MPSKNRIIVASAGSGKTTNIVSQILDRPSEKALVTTFTLSNTAEIRRRFIELNGVVPEYVTINPWFTFVLQELVRPYQNQFYRPTRIRSVNLVSGRSDRYARKSDKQRYFFGNGADIYSDKLSEFALNCNEYSGGKVVARLEGQFRHLYVDEVQDLAGYDLDLLKLFMSSELNTTLVGDHRQATLATNQSPKYKKYRYAGIINLFREWSRTGLCDVEYSAVSHRCRQELCDFADSLFPDDQSAESTNTETTEHDGVFSISVEDADDYILKFSPQILRYKKTTNCGGHAAMNFRISKGLSFDRVLIYPHKNMRDYLTSADLSLLKEPHLLYVAATRARQSLAFVCDEDVAVPTINKYISS